MPISTVVLAVLLLPRLSQARSPMRATWLWLQGVISLFSRAQSLALGNWQLQMGKLRSRLSLVRA
ncbi:MAG TPA: hypothetical protein V6D04_12155 [Candidatus Obscuribacterales bacterium]